MTFTNESKTTVILPVRKEEHIDFLRDLFNGARGQPIKINRKEFVGRYIFSLRKYANSPQRQIIPNGMTGVEIEFPDTEVSTCKKHFCFFPVEHVEQINDFISAAFDLYFHVYFLDTRDIDRIEEEADFSNIEITREVLVDSFVFGLDMVDPARANETIKKREYRRQMKEMTRIRNKFLKKEYRFRRDIYLKRRNYLRIMLFENKK